VKVWLRATIARGFLIALVGSYGCDARDDVRIDGPSGTRITDLIDKVADGAPSVSVQEFDGDFRTAWVTPLGDAFSVRFELAADDCELVFGVRAKGARPPDGIEAIGRVSRRAGNGWQPVFEESLPVGPKPGAAWRDRRVQLPARADGGATSTELLFDSDMQGAGPAPGVTLDWSIPHVACRSMPIRRQPRPARPHVVLISIDTLRADHMSLYGYRRETTPFLDQFAKHAFVFERAFSTAPWTAPAHASMFTGLYPEQHRTGRDDPYDPLPEDVDTLAGILRDAGYRTFGFTAGGVMAPESGLGRGFDRYDSYARTRLRSYFPAIFEEVERHASEPIFLFVHTYDVHGPYIQPRINRSFVADAEDPRVSDEEWSRIRTPGPHDYQRFERFEGLQDVVAAYDSGIRYVDGEIELLFAPLRAAGVLDEALVIITSDHGEALYDRGLYIGHTITLHDELLHVPLVVRTVGQEMGERRHALTDSTDLLPMILDELGLDRPPGLAGRNPLRSREDVKPFVHGEAAHVGSAFIRSDRHKVITPPLDFSDPRSRAPGPLRDRLDRGPQWFDLTADARERQNLYSPEGATDASVSAYRVLEQHMREELEIETGVGKSTPPDLSEKQREELRSLGYAE